MNIIIKIHEFTSFANNNTYTGFLKNIYIVAVFLCFAIFTGVNWGIDDV